MNMMGGDAWMKPYYILDDERKPKRVGLDEWVRWYETADRKVAKDVVGPDEALVSTVFLGVEHGFRGQDPLVFETMIFGGKHDEHTERYCSWDEAVAGHDRAVRIAKGVSAE